MMTNPKADCHRTSPGALAFGTAAAPLALLEFGPSCEAHCIVILYAHTVHPVQGNLMSWRVEPTEPTRTLDAWMVLEVPFAGTTQPWTRHLVGWRVEGGRGQVSSAAEVPDASKRLVQTRSGRVYELRHGPGLNGDASATW